jgi:lipoprotein-anchoring transpeptidase ErfK/SrfK
MWCRGTRFLVVVPALLITLFSDRAVYAEVLAIPQTAQSQPEQPKSGSPLFQIPTVEPFPQPDVLGVTAPPLPTVEPLPPSFPATTPLISPEPELPAPSRSTPLYIETQPIRLEIKLSQRQVTVYQGDRAVKRYAIAIGRPGWETPVGRYRVEQMFRNPAWVHPLKPGITIPGGDPENPLGRHWIGFWTDGKNWIGFHGTDNPGSVGRAVSHGCVRMHNKDIEEIFQKVNLGTEVKVVY